MHISDFKMSRHAINRILDMNIEPDVVVRAVTQPDAVRPCKSRPAYELYDAGDITVSVARDNNTIVTVLWRTAEAWEKDLAEGPAFPGRQYRPNPFAA